MKAFERIYNESWDWCERHWEVPMSVAVAIISSVIALAATSGHLGVSIQ